MSAIYRFRDLVRWDAFTLPTLPIPAHWPQARMGDLIVPRKERVDLAANDFASLQLISISFGGHVTRRKVKDGRTYTMALLWARYGDIVLSKIDLKNGAVGVLNENIEEAAVTTHFAVYTPILDLLSPAYLKLLIQTGAFKRWLRAARSGADGRTEVKLELFEDLNIPLPPPDEQRTLVAAYHAALTKATALEAAAATAEADGLAAFEAALGLAAPAPLPDVPRFIARFSAMDRWSHEAVLRQSAGDSSGTGTYPMVKLRDVVADVRVGVSPRCHPRPREGDSWGVLKLSAVTGGKFKPEENKAVKLASDRNAALEIHEGDVLIARGSGITKFVGAACIVDRPVNGLMLCDLVFRVEMLAETPIDNGFLANVLGIPTVRRQIESTRTGAAPGIQKTTKKALLGLTFPLPTDIAEQRSLIAALEQERSKAFALRQKAVAKRARAWAAFEAAIYGE